MSDWDVLWKTRKKNTVLPGPRGVESVVRANEITEVSATGKRHSPSPARGPVRSSPTV